MITRENLVEQSVTDFVRAGVQASDLSSKIEIREAFPTEEERAKPLVTTQLAVGFNFDDGGKLLELGSDLTERVYTITFWTFGTTVSMGRTTANLVRQLVEQAGNIPLKQIDQAGQPVIDYLTLPERQAATVTRQIAHQPRPWDLYVWNTVLKVIDAYYPSQF